MSGTETKIVSNPTSNLRTSWFVVVCEWQACQEMSGDATWWPSAEIFSNQGAAQDTIERNRKSEKPRPGHLTYRNTRGPFPWIESAPETRAQGAGDLENVLLVAQGGLLTSDKETWLLALRTVQTALGFEPWATEADFPVRSAQETKPDGDDPGQCCPSCEQLVCVCAQKVSPNLSRCFKCGELVPMTGHDCPAQKATEKEPERCICGRGEYYHPWRFCDKYQPAQNGKGDGT